GGAAGRRGRRSFGEVAPRPVAAELARGYGGVRYVAAGDDPRLDAVVAANPGAREVTLAKERRNGEARTRVTAGAATGDHDVNHVRPFDRHARDFRSFHRSSRTAGNSGAAPLAL